MALNCFGCPLSTLETHFRSTTGKAEANKADNEFHSCGVWPLASYINHSCDSNARRSFIADMMIVRATRDIPRASEITFWYQTPWGDEIEFENKVMDLSHWGFKCSCVICEDRHKTAKRGLNKRKELIAQLENILSSCIGNPHPPTAKVERLLSSLEATYRRPGTEVPRLSLWMQYLKYATVCATLDQFKNVVEYTVKALESLGYIIEGASLPHTPGIQLKIIKWGLIVDNLVGAWMVLSSAFEQVAPALVGQAEEYARITYMICIGEEKTFDQTYSRNSRRFDGLLVMRG
jgi:hypothetical protein